ncbi:MAG: c-type cytochrome [Nitrospirae bacterium]|nr:c-type cytochrome [Nitrospirota bacterium]
MSNAFFKIVVFTAVVLASFSYMSYSIPQQASLPPVKEQIDPATIKTKGELIAVGRKLFFGKGQCALCHSIGHSEAARCPDLAGIGAKLTREFLHESLTHPDTFTYMDYASDPPRPFPAEMPRINRPPVDLNEPELLAVIAFVQSLGGEVTVEPRELAAFLPPPVIQGDPAAGRQVANRMQCLSCHQNLPSMIGKYADLRTLRAAIIRPAGGPVDKKEGNPPHQEFDRKLSVRELDDLLAYLRELRPKAQEKGGSTL